MRRLKGAVLAVLVMVSGQACALGLFGPNVDAVKKRLNDPYSVKFEGVRKVDNGAVCGQFNAKNQYGAYAGRKEFAIVDGAAYLEGDTGEEDVIILHCIRGENCKDSDCLDEVRQQLDKERKSVALAPNIGQFRGLAAAACRNHTQSDPAKMVECNNAVVECRKEKYALDEARCLSDVIGKYE